MSLPDDQVKLSAVVLRFSNGPPTVTDAPLSLAVRATVVGDEIYLVHPHFADGEPPSVSRAEFR